jgi:hypothetical protein
MVEAPNPCRLHPTSISHVYTVFKEFLHFDMLWTMAVDGLCIYGVMRVHPYYPGYACAGGGGFLENWGIWLGPSDDIMTWLRLQTPVDCIPHSYHMYTKCFNTLTCYGLWMGMIWVHTSTVIPVQQLELGGEFW